MDTFYTVPFPPRSPALQAPECKCAPKNKCSLLLRASPHTHTPCMPHPQLSTRASRSKAMGAKSARSHLTLPSTPGVPRWKRNSSSSCGPEVMRPVM